MKELKIELMDTLANELNNNKWEFDNRQVVTAATDHTTGKLVLVLTDGVAIESYTLTLSRERRKHVTRRKSKGANKKHSRT